jgi:hypothetical protein
MGGLSNAIPSMVMTPDRRRIVWVGEGHDSVPPESRKGRFQPRPTALGREQFTGFPKLDGPLAEPVLTNGRTRSRGVSGNIQQLTTEWWLFSTRQA